MKRQQRWTPDTCANSATGDACVFVEEWDDAADPYARTHAFVSAEKLCSHHAAIHGSDHAAAFQANYDENRMKNKVFAIVQAMKADPNFPIDSFKWSFDAERNLTVDFGNSLTADEKRQLRAYMDIQFGQNKVMMP